MPPRTHSPARLLAAALAALIAAGAAPAHAADPADHPPADWAARLGAGTYAEREEAAAALLALGHAARDAVQAQLASPDPEIRTRAHALWQTLRWHLIPGLAPDTIEFLRTLPQAKSPNEGWDTIIARYGARTLLLAPELCVDPARAPGAQYMVRTVLERHSPAALAAAVRAEPDPARAAYLTVLERCFNHESASLPAVLNLAGLYNTLGEYARAFALTRRAWPRWPKPALLALGAESVTHGTLAEPVWTEAGPELAGTADATERCRVLAFYVELAGALKTPEPARRLARQTDVAGCETTAVHQLADALLRAGFHAELVLRLRGQHDPKSLYYRSVARAALGEKRRAKKEWAELLDRLDELKDESLCYALADLMDERGDPRAAEVWLKILAVPPADDVYDANAWLRLARWAERRRHPREAADYYERALAILDRMRSAGTGTGLVGMSEDDLRAHIQRLRNTARQ